MQFSFSTVFLFSASLPMSCLTNYWFGTCHLHPKNMSFVLVNSHSILYNSSVIHFEGLSDNLINSHSISFEHLFLAYPADHLLLRSAGFFKIAIPINEIRWGNLFTDSRAWRHYFLSQRVLPGWTIPRSLPWHSGEGIPLNKESPGAGG